MNARFFNWRAGAKAPKNLDSCRLLGGCRVFCEEDELWRIMKKRLIDLFAGATLAAILAATAARAQAPPAETQSPLAPQSAPARQSQAASQLTPQRLAQMLAPIALYPDELLGDILMAATYPLDVVKAARWIQDPRSASLKGDEFFAALQEQDWTRA